MERDRPAAGLPPPPLDKHGKERLQMKPVAYAQAIKRKYPEPVCLVVTADAGGKPNIIPVGWAVQTSVHPPMLAISVAKQSYSHALIEAGRQFVLCFPGEDLVDQALFCGAHSGRDTDKFGATRLTPLPAERVKPPLIAECLAAFECSLVGEVSTGDHTLFVGEVLKSHVSDKTQRRLFSLGNGMLGGV